MRKSLTLGLTLLVVTLIASAGERKDCAGKPRFVSGDHILPSVLQRVDPNIQNCRGKYSGNAVVSCIVTSTGTARNVRIIHSVAPCIDKAVLEALRKWRFCPGEHNGKLVDDEIRLTVTIHYK